MTEYRAAYVNDCVLTGPEHQNLTDEDLLTEAMAEADRMGIIGQEAPNNLAREKIQIGMWSGR